MKQSMLVLDSYRGHVTENIKAALEKSRTDLVIIPAGLTSILQPTDVEDNKPFKHKLKQMYEDYMATTQHQFTPDGQIKKTIIRTHRSMNLKNLGQDR